MTKIISNGSHWAGEEESPLASLFEVLATQPLLRSFERYGNFIQADPEIEWLEWQASREFPHIGRHVPGPSPYAPLMVHRFWGNFLNVSHVFSIDTDEPELIERLTAAIRANQQRPDYLAQPKPKLEEEERKAVQS